MSRRQRRAEATQSTQALFRDFVCARFKEYVWSWEGDRAIDKGQKQRHAEQKERERERERATGRRRVCVCVRARKLERQHDKEIIDTGRDRDTHR